MAATIGRVRAVFSASTSGLTSGVNQASASMRKMQSSVSSLKGGLTALTMINGAQLFGSIASSASSAVRSLLSMGSAQAEVVDKTSKLASRLGMTYAELAGLEHAGALAGVGLDTIGTAATRIDVAVVGAANNSEKAKEKFTKLGLAAVAVAGDSGAADVALQKLGLSTVAVVGGSDAADAALQKLGLSAVAVVGGSDAAGAALQKLGLSSATLGGMAAPQRLEAITDAIARLPDEAERAAAKVSLLGQAGTDLASMTAPQKLQTITAAISKLPGAAEQAAAKLALLGQAGTDLSSMNPLERMQAITDAVSKIPDVAERAAVKLVLLGAAGSDLNSMNAEQRFQAIAEAISKLPTEAEKSAAAIAFFGKSGAAMLPMFKDGAAGLQAMAIEAERFGKNLTNAQGVDIEDMNDSFSRVQEAISGVVKQLVARLAPAVTALTTAFSDMIGNVGGATIGQRIGDGIMAGARFLAMIADYVYTNFKGVFDYFQAVGSRFGAVWDVASRVVSFLEGVVLSLKTVWLFAAFVMGKTIAGLLDGLKGAGELMWFDMSGLDPAIEAMKEFANHTFYDSVKSAKGSVAAFKAAFADSAPAWGKMAAGPITTTLDAALAKAKASASNIDKASKPMGIVRQEIKVEIVKKQETKGIESRSAEGIKEMFRLMRGPTEADDIAKQQLQALENIADNTEDDGGADVDEYDLAPAAGA